MASSAAFQPLSVALLSSAHPHALAYAQILQRHPELRLAAIWDDDIARGRALAAEHGVPFEEDLQTVLQQPEIDAVLIASENAAHYHVGLAACAAGKHILCEKPLAITPDEARALCQAAADAGVVLATAFPMRHSAPALAVKRALDAGSIGQVLAVRATNHGLLPPGWFRSTALAGGGAVTDHTVHVLDLLRWYLQSEVVQVYAEISHGLYGLEVEDSAQLTITFANGVIATLDPSWSRPSSYPTWGDVTMEIAGSTGMLQLDAFAQQLHYYPESAGKPAWLEWGEDTNEAMLLDFARAVRQGSAPAASGWDGLRAVEVVAAAYASARAIAPVSLLLP